QREQRRPWDTANFPQGYYKQQDVYFLESNTDALLTFKDDLTSDISINASLGANAMSGETKLNNSIVRGLVLPGIYKLSNAVDNARAENEIIKRKSYGVYGLVNLSWKDQIYLDITGRNDWASTLPSENQSYFYPSVSSSFVLSDIFELPSQITFAKAR